LRYLQNHEDKKKVQIKEFIEQSRKILAKEVAINDKNQEVEVFK